MSFFRGLFNVFMFAAVKKRIRGKDSQEVAQPLPGGEKCGNNEAIWRSLQEMD